MAGLYPDVLAPRMAWDIDGTVFVRTDTNRLNPVQQSLAHAQALNDETDSNNQVNTGYATLIFPQLRDIAGYYVRFEGQVGTNSIGIWTSVNTTNGVDGTWVNQGNWVNGSGTVASIRNNINSVNFAGIKAISFGGQPTGGWWEHTLMHIYGRISAGETPDRLRMWHPTLDEPLDDNTAADGAHLDWAEATRGTTADKSFRIKNNSATLTANSVAISTDVRTDASPAISPQITYSDGGAFAASINIGNLTPGAISSTVTVRRTTASNAALSLWWWRTIAESGSWT